jgi:broad specificity phosphatase PhoE
LRHGESEANADHTLWRTKPDNMINLTDNGIRQAKEAGQRIEAVFQSYENSKAKNVNEKKTETPGRCFKRVQIYASPFERTLQTTIAARLYFNHRVVQTIPESRIREQEFGNFSKRDLETFRDKQLKVGRFWYRFPTGESGADVYDRIKSWWCESILTTNERPGFDHVDAVVVVTHSLSMRFVLMQLYNWSPTTFHSVWNTGLCDMYVLRKDLTQRGLSPYVLDRSRGDIPRSSVDLYLRFKKNAEDSDDDSDNDNDKDNDNNNDKVNDNDDDNDNDNIERPVKENMYRLHDYLDVPPPRMRSIGVIKQKLAEQYPDLNIDTIDTISFKINDIEMGEAEHEF